MNYNLLAYSIYCLMIVSIILKVGHICFKNGQAYVGQFLQEKPDLCLTINKILLTGYYLLNIGYGITVISQWKKITTLNQCIESISQHGCYIVLLLAGLHYLNLICIPLIIKKIL